MKKILISLAILASTVSVYAQETIAISTGSPTGTYSKFFKSIQLMCGDVVPLSEINSSGSDENIDNLIMKKADGAFAQSDTLQFVAMNDPRASESQIRVLLPMYPEEVHVVALRDLSKTTGGISFFGKNVGGSKISLNSLADLENVKVGAWGGSYTTARAISYLGSVKYETVKFNSDKEALAALQAGQIAAIVAVGGQPLGFVSGLSNNFKILKVDASLADKVKAYLKTRITYRNLSQDSTETVAARSLLVVRNFASPQKKAQLTALKNCIAENEVKFKEDRGHHPKWADVDFSSPTSWALYETSQPVTVQPKRK